MSHHIVEVKKLKYSYPDGTEALREASFFIRHGESVGIVGANGAGKSTLLLQLNGFLTPAEGTVRIGEYSLTQRTLSQVRRSVGMLFQDPGDQLFMPTVYDDVAFGPLNLGFAREEVDAQVLDALERVGALHLKDRAPHKLSLGEKRLVAMAAVLSMSPDILVMDEPTAGLDPMARAQLIELLKTFEHTKIIATHDLDLLMDLCERTLVLSEGRVTADGPTLEIFDNRTLLAESRLLQPLRLQGCPRCKGGE